MGSLVPIKGFHILAGIWPSIRKVLDNARLLVIGTGDLYERGVRLGKWGIAAEEYEKRIRFHLAQSDGQPGFGVTFLGRLGAEKIPILRAANVGVVNPSGCSEICPVSALEIQACGTPIVSAAKRGLLDTIAHSKTGLLGHGTHALKRNILHLLTNPAVAEKYGQNGVEFVRSNFSYQVVMEDWRRLLKGVMENAPVEPEPVQRVWRNFKFVREAVRVANSISPVRIPSMVEVRDRLRA